MKFLRVPYARLCGASAGWTLWFPGYRSRLAFFMPSPPDGAILPDAMTPKSGPNGSSRISIKLGIA